MLAAINPSSMSSHNRYLEVLPEAEDDIRNILIYTGQQWGTHQLDDYQLKLDAAMQLLVDFPDRGKSRGEISRGLRSLALDSHLIFYRVIGDAIYVLRVVHKKMDIGSLFSK